MPRVATKLTPTAEGGFSARKRIPRDVQADYAQLYGTRWEERFNSGPTTPHIAKAKWREWSGEIETRIANIRAGRRGEGQALTPMQARALAGEWYRWFVAKYEVTNRSASDWDIYLSLFSDEVTEARSDPDNRNVRWEDDSDARAHIRPKLADWGETQQFLAAKRLTLETASMELFLDNLYRDFAAALKLLQRRARGDYSEDKHAREFPDFTATPDPSVTAWHIFERWVAETDPALSTINRWRAVFLKLQDAFPERSANTLSVEEAANWITGLVTAERTEATVRDVWLNGARTVFAWAVEKRLLTRNPFGEVPTGRRRNRKKHTRDTKAFHSSEAVLILRSTLDITDTTRKSKAARRWVPWLCAYTGARSGEITQLRGVDVIERGGIHAITISPDAGTVKTRQARTVPLHEHLIEQGFLKYVERCGKGPLFYNSTPKRSQQPVDATNPSRPRYVKAREDVAAWVRSLGITDTEIKPNHAWRHSFKQIADREGISERVSDAITGHAPANVARGYGAPTLSDMAEALKKFPRFNIGGGSK